MKSFEEYYGNADPIAVIGMACRFPKAPDLEAYWKILSGGQFCGSEFFPQELIAAGVSEATINQDNFVPRAAVIERPDYFDANLFGYSRQEAESIDPQQRLFLQMVWHALEHAGYAPGNVKHKTGVYGTSRISTYPSLANFSVTEVGQVKGMQALLGNDKDYLATRVAHRFNLHGPALTVQTACSSSLVAVHMACESLRGGECDMAIAGGAAISFPQNAGYRYQAGMVFSPDGFCRPFSDQAQGTFGGNGVAAIVLKRLDDALKDGDPVVAVLRGSAINNDGNDKVGFTAPSMRGQQQVIHDALQLADIDPGEVGMVEAHGTGTTLGDPIEIAALQKAYGSFSRNNQKSRSNSTTKKSPCFIGSVKSNLGHLDTAAGIASLIKTILAVHHGEIPPTLHVDRVNPKLQLDNTCFAIATEKKSWTQDIRTAGVSSFGIGGTNCHMVVQSLPESLNHDQFSYRIDDKYAAPVLLLSAASEASLTKLASTYGQYLEQYPEQKHNIAYTALHGRQLDLPYRLVAKLDKQTISDLKVLENKTTNPDILTGYADKA
ncbi:MAG: polyketide synthase, partial [Cellvibrionaceae bacterium]|nr:polyketide synthase [Cellvibrionaceae bacterium]